MNRYVCIHGHFYQPPRENPWLEAVELQDSAYPYHDWNERITAECYEPNTSSRIVDGEGRILELINNYSRMSFNVGPTLCAWMASHRPEVLEAIVAADRLSKERFGGHGSAVAQVYNHMIMPLANRRDKVTQVSWGIDDFLHRFGRHPEGMWLPETAVDLETLDVLAELKMKFAVLAPRQAKRVKALTKGARWHEVGEAIDPTTSYMCQLPSGRSIVLFFYDGPISQDMAFGGLLNNGETFAARLTGVFDDARQWPQLVHVATDGESYGHHHRHGDMALSYCLHTIEKREDVALTNYGEFTELHAPTHLVEIHENSSWSCIHGVERWRENCGCNSGREGWTQAWRRPLRQALDWLRDEVAPAYEREAGSLLASPWRARDEYIEVVLDRSRDRVNTFLERHAARELSLEDKTRALKLLELQRQCMLMYTSCGWFFDEISGIETTQVLQYAARALQLSEESMDMRLEDEFMRRLGEAPSNVLENGAAVYRSYVQTARMDLIRIAAHYALYSVVAPPGTTPDVYCYVVETEPAKTLESGRLRLGVGVASIGSVLTWDTRRITYAVLHPGDHSVTAGVREFGGEEAFRTMEREITAEFDRGNTTQVVQLMLRHFGDNNYSLWHLFRDEQRRVLHTILQDAVRNTLSTLRQIVDQHTPVVNFLRGLRQPVPHPILAVVEEVVNEDLQGAIEASHIDLARLDVLLTLVGKWSLTVRKEGLRLAGTRWLTDRMTALAETPLDTTKLESIDASMQRLNALQLDLDLWKAQNIYFQVSSTVLADQRARAAEGDSVAERWVRLFTGLGGTLGIRVA